MQTDVFSLRTDSASTGFLLPWNKAAVSYLFETNTKSEWTFIKVVNFYALIIIENSVLGEITTSKFSAPCNDKPRSR